MGRKGERGESTQLGLVKKSLPSSIVMHRSPLRSFRSFFCVGAFPLSVCPVRVVGRSRDWQNFYPRHQQTGRGEARVEIFEFILVLPSVRKYHWTLFSTFWVPLKKISSSRRPKPIIAQSLDCSEMELRERERERRPEIAFTANTRSCEVISGRGVR